jgi:UDP-glucose 4-epimerase
MKLIGAARTSGAYGAVFGVFLAQKLQKKPFTVVGDGRQTRDFTFVTDVVDAMVTAAQSDLRVEVLNVGSSHTYSVNRLVKLLQSDVVYIPKRPGEPDYTWADVSKIRQLLGWEPKVSFEKGVKILLENIDYWKNTPLWTPDTIQKATADWFKYLQK